VDCHGQYVLDESGLVLIKLNLQDSQMGRSGHWVIVCHLLLYGASHSDRETEWCEGLRVGMNFCNFTLQKDDSRVSQMESMKKWMVCEKVLRCDS
jgi:hypothetical protein